MEQVDLADLRLGDEVECVSAGAAKAGNGYALARESFVECADSRTAGRRVEVLEDRFGLVLDGYDWKGLRGDGRIDFLRLTYDAAEVGRHLVVEVAVVRFGGKRQDLGKTVTQVLARTGILDARMGCPLLWLGISPCQWHTCN